jgi:hexokinase
MAVCPNNKELQNYLEDNGFYSYLDFEKISENYRNELKILCNPENKKSMILPKNWKSITGYGEPRSVLVMELGGAFLQLHDVEIIHNQKFSLKHDQKYNFYDHIQYTPEELFSSICKQLDAFVPENHKTKIHDSVLVFAYALDHYIRADGYYDGIGQQLSKMDQFKNIAGIGIGLELEKYLQAHGYPNIKIAVINDTLAGLLSGKAIEIANGSSFDSFINILVATGVNISVKCDETESNETFLVNTEFGNFRGADLSKFDQILTQKYGFGSDYSNEKMISGNWQHLLMKIILNDLISKKIVPKDIFGNIDIENMDSDEMERATFDTTLNIECQEAVKFLWKEIIRRASTLCGLMLSIVVDEIYHKLGQKNLDIGIIEAGAVLEKAVGFRGNMIKIMNNELQDLDLIEKVKISFFSHKYKIVPGAIVFNSLFTK